MTGDREVPAEFFQELPWPSFRAEKILADDFKPSGKQLWTFLQVAEMNVSQANAINIGQNRPILIFHRIEFFQRFSSQARRIEQTKYPTKKLKYNHKHADRDIT